MGRAPKRTLPGIDIHPLAADSIVPAARLLARSMRDNPLHHSVFGSHEARIEPLLAGLFVRLLRRQMGNGLVFGASAHGSLVGVAAMASPGHCQLALTDKLGMLAVLVRAGAGARLPRIQRWLGAWKRHDPHADHWHLGPAAVERARQGQGIGTGLMVEVCAQLDRRQGIGYLETDKEANVRLYRRGGFEVIAAQRVLGVHNWFMLRQPQARGQTA